MRVAVIGGTGHIGSALVPQLVNAGHDVISVSRQQRRPYQAHAAWAQVSEVQLDRAASDFGAGIAALDAPVVIDFICYTLETAQALSHALTGRIAHPHARR